MPFIARLDEENSLLKKNTKMLFPISLGQKYHTGERLKALIGLAKGYNSTILVADALQRHNLQDEKKALALGDKFLEKNAELFKEAVLIDSAEVWEKYKNDETVIKLIRWRAWGEIKANELKEADKLIEQACLQANSSLIRTMHETAERNLSKPNLSTSIAYQQEENAYLLTFSEFDYHGYPAPLNPSQAETYKLFSQQYKMPVHKSIKFETILVPMENVINKQQRHAQSLPLGLRMLIENIKMALISSEVSPTQKALFMAQTKSIFMSIEHECGTKGNVKETPYLVVSDAYQSPIENNSMLFFAAPPHLDPVETKKDPSVTPSLPSPLTNSQ